MDFTVPKIVCIFGRKSKNINDSISQKKVANNFNINSVLQGFQGFAKAPILTSKELSTPPPRIIRTCCGFGVEVGIAAVPFAKKTDITSREIMGDHTFLGSKPENNGIIYTRRGGFIDMGHLRDCADWTAFLYNLLKASQTDLLYGHTDLRNEGGAKSLDLNVPANFNNDEIIELAGKISFDLSLWHEISTWFGASYVPLVPERFSSFSPEDMYSNLLGVHLGMRAIKSELEYNEAMTSELNNMLDSLEAVNTEAETFEAMLRVNEVWYTNEKKYPNKNVVLKRYIELDEDFIPWLVPGYESKLPPYLLRKPDIALSKYYQLSLKLNFRFPIDSILVGKTDNIITQNDFESFIGYIQTEINKKTIRDKERELKKEENAAHKKRSKRIKSAT